MSDLDGCTCGHPGTRHTTEGARVGCNIGGCGCQLWPGWRNPHNLVRDLMIAMSNGWPVKIVPFTGAPVTGRVIRQERDGRNAREIGREGSTVIVFLHTGERLRVDQIASVGRAA